MENTEKKYTLKNVRLETGFIEDECGIIGTNTELFCIEIQGGKIIKISNNNPTLEHAIDGRGMLMLPAFKDMHVHIDKTLYGLPWQALSPQRRKVTDMIAYEQEIIPELLKSSTARAELLIELMQGYGTSYVRSHFNVDPTSGLQSLENLQKALDSKHNTFHAELVAFPQHGLYYTDSTSLMKEACALESVSFVGGLDPFSIDKNIEKAVDFTVQLALDTNKGIDIHLHDAGSEGLKTIQYIIDKVLENPILQDNTYISHAFVLAELGKKDLQTIAHKLADSKVGIVSSIPYSHGMNMPIPALIQNNVKILVGNDNIQDYWSVLGTGNMLQKANLMAGLYGWETEFDLSRSLGFATNQLLPLSNDGQLNWPKQGDDAAFVLIDASCSAEAVARMPKPEALAHHGNLVWL